MQRNIEGKRFMLVEGRYLWARERGRCDWLGSISLNVRERAELDLVLARLTLRDVHKPDYPRRVDALLAALIPLAH